MPEVMNRDKGGRNASVWNAKGFFFNTGKPDCKLTVCNNHLCKYIEDG